jgi:hypothetical protein
LKPTGKAATYQESLDSRYELPNKHPQQRYLPSYGEHIALIDCGQPHSHEFEIRLFVFTITSVSGEKKNQFKQPKSE